MTLALAACGSKSGGEHSGSVSSAPPASSVSVPSQPESVPAPQAQANALGMNALTGLPAAEDMMEGQRPVAVMVMNSQRSLPQRGLAGADVLMEMLIDSSETRLMALYADYRGVPAVGPVPATQDQFVQFALPLDSIQVHIGKTDYARNLLAVLQQKDIDGLHLGRAAFWFDEARTLPRAGGGKLHDYCWFTDANLIFNGMTYIDVHAVGQVPSLFDFAAETAPPAQDAVYVGLGYSGETWSQFWLNADDGLYYKHNFGGPHLDEDGTPLTYTNVIVLRTEIDQKADSGLLEYDFRQGTGWYFTGGAVKEINWTKGGPQDQLKLQEKGGGPLLVQPGKSYIGFAPAYKADAMVWQSQAEMDAQAAQASQALAA